MKVKVNRDACISCGACEAVASDIFELDEEGISVAKVNEVVTDELIQQAKEAEDSCPTGAILTNDKDEKESQ